MIFYNGMQTWKQILRQNFTQWEKLADFLQLSERDRQHILTRSHFPLNVPMRLAQKMAKGTLHDPILRQFLPLKLEQEKKKGFVLDPVGDSFCCKENKLLHKYEGRVLLLCTSACAMNCRFCFRQNFEYSVQDKPFDHEISLIANDPTIVEVILSGGDPLSCSDSVLSKLLTDLSAIPHVKRIRFHTRFPIGIPERIDASFLKILSEVRVQIVFVIHTNHALELDDDVIQKLKLLQQQGVMLLSQSVLLRGVNDDVDTLQALCEKLANNGVVPYYLHQLDRVQGTAHFEVPEEKGRELVQALSRRLSGYAVPKYVREIYGEPSKKQLLP